jgi:hypothetical protein
MNLIFERGDREAPVGHALMYFTGNDGSILATYVSVPPIKFDISKFVPGFMAGVVQGMDLMDTMVATPMPPVPEVVPSVDYLQSLAARRSDDLVYAGGTMGGDPMRLAAESAEAARQYGELYNASAGIPQPSAEQPAQVDGDQLRYADMSEGDKLNELTILTGRLRDSLRTGTADPDIMRQMQAVASTLPAKYRAADLVAAAHTPGERGQRLADLYLQRSYKLFHEEYLDLERIDREIDAISA